MDLLKDFTVGAGGLADLVTGAGANVVNGVFGTDYHATEFAKAIYANEENVPSDVMAKLDERATLDDARGRTADDLVSPIANAANEAKAAIGKLHDIVKDDLGAVAEQEQRFLVKVLVGGVIVVVGILLVTRSYNKTLDKVA